MKEFIKNPYAERIKKHGCSIRITRGNGENIVIIEERVVTPEEIEASNKRRNLTLSVNTATSTKQA